MSEEHISAEEADEMAVQAFLWLRERNRARAQVDYLKRLCERVIVAHEQVVMDTPEDRDLHARAVETFRVALTGVDLVRGDQ